MNSGILTYFINMKHGFSHLLFSIFVCFLVGACAGDNPSSDTREQTLVAQDAEPAPSSPTTMVPEEKKPALGDYLLRNRYNRFLEMNPRDLLANTSDLRIAITPPGSNIQEPGEIDITKPATTENPLNSNVKRVIFFQPEFTDGNSTFTAVKTEEDVKKIAKTLKDSGYTAVAMPVFFGRHPELTMEGVKLKGDLKKVVDGITNPTVFKRDCEGNVCGIAKILEDGGVGVLPEIVLFQPAYGNQFLGDLNMPPVIQTLGPECSKWYGNKLHAETPELKKRCTLPSTDGSFHCSDIKCVENKVNKCEPLIPDPCQRPGLNGEVVYDPSLKDCQKVMPPYLDSPCTKKIPDGFTMWNDKYWSGIEATFRAAAKFACTGHLPQKAILIEGEHYMQYADKGFIDKDGTGRVFWTYNDGHTDEERLIKTFERGQQIARGISNECNGNEIELFTYIGLDESNIAFFAGLTAPEVKDKDNKKYNIKRISFFQSPYYRGTGSSFIFDLKYRLNGWLKKAGLMAVNAIAKKYPSTEVNELFKKRGDVALWATVYYDRFWGFCTHPEPEVNKYSEDHFRSYRIGMGLYKAVPWFDVPPEYAFNEMEILKRTKGGDAVFIYQGSNHYLCGKDSAFCPDGDYKNVWLDKINEPVWDKDGVNKGRKNACSNLTKYLSPDVIDKRAQDVSSAIEGLTRDKTYTKFDNDEIGYYPDYELNGNYNKLEWNVEELEITRLDKPWKRVKGYEAGDPEYVLEVKPDGSGEIYKGAVANIVTMGGIPAGLGGIPYEYSEDVIKHRDIIGDYDHYVWVYFDFGKSGAPTRLNLEGVNVKFDKIDNDSNNFDPNAKYTGWHWVRMARRVLQGFRNELAFTGPEYNMPTRIGGIKYVPAKDSEKGTEGKRMIRGLELQDWMHGTGWERDAISGGLKFDPTKAITIEDGFYFPYAAEWIGLPGRIIAEGKSFSACMLVNSDGEAKFEYMIPGWDVNIIETTLPAGKRWTHAYAGFGFSPSYRQWQVTIIPKIGTSSFTVEAVQMIDPILSKTVSGNFDEQATKGFCNTLPIPK